MSETDHQRDPSPTELDSPEFNAIWNVIKSWDINDLRKQNGVQAATGNHVVEILKSLGHARERGLGADKALKELGHIASIIGNDDPDTEKEIKRLCQEIRNCLFQIR